MLTRGSHVAFMLDGAPVVGRVASTHAGRAYVRVGQILAIRLDRDVVETDQPVTSPRGAIREHSVPCCRCGGLTWNHDALCGACEVEAPHHTGGLFAQVVK